MQIELLAAGWPAELPDHDESDLVVSGLYALVPRLREVAMTAATEAQDQAANPLLSAQGVVEAKRTIGARAMEAVNAYTAAESARAALAARQAATAPPSLQDVPTALVGPVMNALANMDGLVLKNNLLTWIDQGDYTAAVVALSAPAPFAMLSAADKADVAAALRRARYGVQAERADALARAVQVVETAARAVRFVIKEKCGMGTAPAQVEIAPKPVHDPLKTMAKTGRMS